MSCVCRYVCHEFNAVTVLMLQLHSYVSICGKVLARCISGNVVVHGFSMNIDVGWQKLFSPSTHSLLVIKAVDGQDAVDEADDWMLKLSYKDRQQVESYSNEYPIILLMQRLICPAYDFVTNSDEFRLLRSEVSGIFLKSVDVTLIGPDVSAAVMKEPESFGCVAAELAHCCSEGGFSICSLSFCVLVIQFC